MIGVAHPKWTERPLLVVVPHPGRQPSKAELLGYFQVLFTDDFPSWLMLWIVTCEWKGSQCHQWM